MNTVTLLRTSHAIPARPLSDVAWLDGICLEDLCDYVNDLKAHHKDIPEAELAAEIERLEAGIVKTLLDGKDIEVGEDGLFPTDRDEDDSAYYLFEDEDKDGSIVFEGVHYRIS